MKKLKLLLSISGLLLAGVASAQDGVSCYLLTDSKFNKLNCTMSHRESIVPLKNAKHCHDVDDSSISEKFTEIDTIEFKGFGKLTKRHTGINCGAGGDGWIMNEKTLLAFNNKSVAPRYRNAVTGKITTHQQIMKHATSYARGDIKNAPNYVTCIAPKGVKGELCSRL